MRRIWTASPVLLLILWVAGAQADDPSWHKTQAAASASSTDAVTLGQPIAAEDASTVSLGQPQALNTAPALLDPQLRQATFSDTLGTPTALIARAKGPDSPMPLPLGDPVKGPTISDTAPATGTSSDTGATPSSPAVFSDLVADGGACGCGTCGPEASCVPCDGICDNCDCCPAQTYCFWLRAEYLNWTIRPDSTPPLVTTGPQASLGALGQPGTSILFGGDLDRGDFSGGRFTAGMWLDPSTEWGVEGSIFFLGQRSVDFSAFSPGSPVLARPITSPTGAQGVEQIANLSEVINGIPVLPTFGSVTVRAPSDLWGAEANGIMGLCRGDWGRLDLIGGFRYVSLQEAIDIGENVTIAANSPINPGANFLVSDTFSTHNEFYGGQVGLRSELYWGNWQLDLTGKVAVGSTRETVNINGSTGIAQPGTVPTFFQGGLLALPTNIGTYSRDRVAVVPEFGLNLGYQLTPHWRIFVGYDIMYWSHVARPGAAIDTVVNATQVPRFGGSAATLVGPARPAFTFNDSGFWAQGANIGIEFRY
jgi:hypothetical protein